MENTHDAIIISDLHLGSRICQAILLQKFLHAIQEKTKELILNGDIFDSWDFRRLQKQHWKVLSQIRHLSDKINITWLFGNHDGPAEIVSHLLGLEVKEEYILVSGGKKILILHGHQFDTFIPNHPITVYIGDLLYHFMQRIDPSFWMARAAKRASKSFLRNAEKVKVKAIEYAKKKKCDIVCVGHCHHPEEDCNYFNSGSWAELPPHYLEIDNGVVKLKEMVIDE